jgi:hypothetical protein
MSSVTQERLEMKVETDKNGTIWCSDDDGNFHNPNGPAVVWKGGPYSYWIHGRRHREDGPAERWYDGEVAYWLNGEHLTFTEFFAKLNPEQREALLLNLARGEKD